MRRIFLFLFFSLYFFNPSLGDQSQSALPFQVGERLEYDLKWGFFSVGSAVMEVNSLSEVEGQACYLIKFSVRTNSFADKFYKVRTSIESSVAADFSKSVLYSKSQEEGSTKRKVLVKYDYNQLKAVYSQDGQVRSTTAIPQNVFDPLSIAYFFRLQELKPNQEETLPTCDGKSFRIINVRTGEKKKIAVPAGTFYAIETIPELKNIRGVFKKSPKGMLRVWYSTCSRRLPVKISSKVVVGSFVAELRKTSGLK
jgi:hypothetical protein